MLLPNDPRDVYRRHVDASVDRFFNILRRLELTKFEYRSLRSRDTVSGFAFRLHKRVAKYKCHMWFQELNYFALIKADYRTVTHNFLDTLYDLKLFKYDGYIDPSKLNRYLLRNTHVPQKPF